ncbi:sulfite reductase (NADPH) flavoprotein alpha-component [Agrobacterium vitis]|nr:sulfite reductase (NADPH) flavoprotein alpha-component [Agrobacterium vitis]
MIRLLHRWFALLATVLLVTLAVSGVALSVFPIMEALTIPPAQQITVAQLASRVRDAEPTVEQIRRAPSGRITAYYFDGDQAASAVIDPATGKPVGPADTPAVERWLINFHRALFLGDQGRIITAVGAAIMLLMSISGLFLLVRRAGGWRYVLRPVRDQGKGQLHSVIARVTLPGLILSSLTALWMAAATFGYLPEGSGTQPFPATVSGKTGIALDAISTLQTTPIDELRSLNFPSANDATDVFTLKTTAGEGYLDQGTGAVLAWRAMSWVDQTSDLITMLHTGQGMAWLGLLLGLCAFGVPFLGWTGIASWLSRRGHGKVASVSASAADTIVLVASETGTTRGFAATLQSALTSNGLHVHVGSMTGFEPARWPKAKRIILLAATYGDGAAPASASGFLEVFKAVPPCPHLSLAVLGFGDRSFPHFCGFAAQLAEIAKTNGWAELLPFDTIDRQSPQDFSRWGRNLAKALDLDFELNHQPATAKTWSLTLISRRDYGASVQAMTAILRFDLPKASLWQRLTGQGFAPFEAGDLVGIVPQGSDLPRFYSLASSSKDGFLEICVRKHAGGLCSGQLTALEPGDAIPAFVRHNPAFRPLKTRKPVILVGAGTGIGPLVGFARANAAHRPMHLYFGARHPGSDALYAEELLNWSQDGRLASVTTAYSRAQTPAYVQDSLRKDAAKLCSLIKAGGQVLVCGGTDMAAGVAAALSDILAGDGIHLSTLKAQGRYAEDVY